MDKCDKHDLGPGLRVDVPLPEGPALNVRREAEVTDPQHGGKVYPDLQPERYKEIVEGSYEAHMICEHCGNEHWRGCMADKVADALDAIPGALIEVPDCTTAKEFGKRVNEARRLVEVGRRGIDKKMEWSSVARFDFGGKTAKPAPTLTTDSKQRKDTPVYSGVLAYFPLALAAVAQLSKVGSDKHNPGQPLHWSKDKSNDHADCIARHLLELGTIDPDDGFLHDVKLAWRALANLQIRLEKNNAT